MVKLPTNSKSSLDAPFPDRRQEPVSNPGPGLSDPPGYELCNGGRWLDSPIFNGRAGESDSISQKWAEALLSGTADRRYTHSPRRRVRLRLIRPPQVVHVVDFRRVFRQIKMCQRQNVCFEVNGAQDVLRTFWQHCDLRSPTRIGCRRRIASGVILSRSQRTVPESSDRTTGPALLAALRYGTMIVVFAPASDMSGSISIPSPSPYSMAGLGS